MRFVGVRFVLFGILFAGVMGLVTVTLWNALMPEIFGLPSINFWQALGLLVLSRVLFGRLGGVGHGMRKARFVRGWKDLTPEERQRFCHAIDPNAPRSGAGSSAAGSTAPSR
jgi:hypothetical protein